MTNNEQQRRPTAVATVGIGLLIAMLCGGASSAVGAQLAVEYEPSGKSVEGASSVDDAPELTSGRYVDKVPADGTVYYKVKRSAKGSVIHAGAMSENDPDDDRWSSVGIATLVADSEDSTDGLADCNSTSLDKIWLDAEKQPYSNGATSTWATDPESACATADEVIIGISNEQGVDANLPIQLAIYEEPPLEDPAGRDLKSASPVPSWTALEAGDARTGDMPSNTLTDAPILDDGTYAFEIKPNDVQVVAVELDWGQNVQAMLEAKVSDELLGDVGDPAQLAVDVINPVLANPQANLDPIPAGWVSGADLSTAQAIGTFRTGAQTYDINYLNRSVSESANAALPGRHYVRVRMAADGNADASLKYTLTLKRNGDAGDGAPKYAESGDVKAPGADTDIDSGSGLPLLALGIGLLGLCALAAAGVFVYRARAARTS